MRVTGSVFRLGSGLVNSYLVEDSGLVTIIDAGLPGYWRALPRELAAMGCSLDDVRALVLTHGDTDHVGFAEQLRRERNVQVYVHALDAGRARGEVKKPAWGWRPVKIKPLLGFLGYGAPMGWVPSSSCGIGCHHGRRRDTGRSGGTTSRPCARSHTWQRGFTHAVGRRHLCWRCANDTQCADW